MALSAGSAASEEYAVALQIGGSSNGTGVKPSVLDLAEYIAELSGELADLARSADLDLLAYLLDMAQREASTQADHPTDT